MTEVTDIWNTQCTLTNNVLAKARVVDLGIGEQIYLVTEKTEAGRSEHYYAQSPLTTITTQKDEEGNAQTFRNHSLQSVFHQAERPPPQGTNAQKSILQCATGTQGQKIKDKVSWSH